MDIPGRFDAEARLASRLDGIFGSVRQAARRGEMPDWQDVEDRMAQAIEEEQLAVFVVLFLLFWNDFTQKTQLDPGAFPVQAVEALGGRWASANARRVADRFTANAASEMVSAAQNGKSLLDASPTRARADVIAATEVTRAGSEAETVARDEVSRRAGIRIVSYWITERDAKVCPICRPLDREPESTWRRQFPSGPPAHPNCRCFLDHEIEDA